MSFKLEVMSEEPAISWKKFIKNYPAFSIGLDGAVTGRSRFTMRSKGPFANFNHHEGCDRLTTRATCKQVLMAIRMGLFQSFRRATGEINRSVYVNDCDEDVCLSVFLLRHGFLPEYANNPALNRLVEIEDELDTTAGAYPFPPDLPILRQILWIFEPYRVFRHSGGLVRADPADFLRIIIDVERRIMLHITGNGSAASPDTRFKVIGGGKKWSLIEEAGVDARMGALGKGIMAYVMIRPRQNGRWTYIVGRVSAFINYFPVHLILRDLNKAERLTNNADRWGGGNNEGTLIGGSPRVAGSKLTPNKVETIINKRLSSMCRNSLK